MTKYFSLIGGLIIITVTWLAGAGGLFGLPDSVFYDYCARLSRENKRAGADILLIESHAASVAHGDETWLKLLQTLEEMQPEKIMFAFTPRHVSLRNRLLLIKQKRG